MVASSVRWGFLELEGSMLNADASVKLTYPLKHSTPRNLAGTGEHHEKHDDVPSKVWKRSPKKAEVVLVQLATGKIHRDPAHIAQIGRAHV